MRGWYKMKAPPGAAIVVIKNDTVFYRGGFGHREVSGTAKVDSLTVFRAGSLGKTVIALGIFQLVEAGKLALTTRVDSILGDINEECLAGWGPELQIQHLLEHSSGLDEMHFNEYYSDEKLSLKEALLRNPASKRLRWAPGTTASYSNIGYAMLALIGERVTGSDWNQWLRDSVLTPLGMDASGFGMPAAEGNRALGHEGLQTIEDHQYLYRPSVSFYATISDLGRLLRCLLRQGAPLLQPETMLRMESMRTTPAGRGGLEVGYAAGVQNDFVAGWLCRYHTGKVDGFTAIYEYFPEQKSGFAVLFNGTPEGSIRSAALVHASRAQCIPKRDLPDEPIYLKEPLQTIDPDEFAGTYSYANPRNAIPGFFDEWMLEAKVERVSERVFSINGEKWNWIGSGRLVRSKAIHAGAVFSKDPRTGKIGLTMGKLHYTKGGGAWYRTLFRWAIWALSLIFLLGWMFSWLRKRRQPWGLIGLALPIMIAELAFYLFLDAKPTGLGEPTARTIFIYALTWLVPLSILPGLQVLVKMGKKGWRRPIVLFPGILLILDLILFYVLLEVGVIGMATWNY